MAEVTPGVAAPPPRGVFASLRLAPFRYLWLNSFLAFFGTGFQIIAVQAFVIMALKAQGRADETTSAAALVPFSNLMPLFLFTLLGGVWADRFERRRLIIVAQLLRLVGAVALTALCWIGRLEPVMAYVLLFLMGTAQAIVQPTRLALVPRLVPRGHLLNAVALTNLAQHGSMILAPPLAGILISGAGVRVALVVHTLILAVAVVPLFWLRVPPHEVNAADDHRRAGVAGMLHDLRQALGDCWRDRRLRALIFTCTLPGLFFLGPFMALSPQIAREMYAADVRMQGFIMGAVGFGMLIGGLATGARHDLTGRGFKMAAALGCGAAMWLLVGRIPYPAVGLPLLFLWGASGGVFFNLNQTLIHGLVNDAQRGRVMSIVTLATQGCGPIGIVVASAIAQALGAGTTIAVGVAQTIQLSALGVLTAVVGLLLLRAQAVRLN